MLKLFILDNLSAFSSDTVFKICLSLEEKGLQEENIERFDSYDDMFDAIATALEDGDHAIVASENADYLAVKNALIPYFALQGGSSSAVAEAIAKHNSTLEDIDMEAQSLSPIGATVLLSPDGLYSGFSTIVSAGRLTCMPLDFSRVDAMIASLVDKIILRGETMAEMGVESEIRMPDFDLVPAVTEMVNTLNDADKTIALCTSEATMWIYNLYDKIDYLTDTIKFADVEAQEDESAQENESAAVIAKARDAMMNVGADFGGAVSEVYSSYNEEGNIVYYAFAAVVDNESANAKKINITDSTNLSIMLPHAVTLLSGMVCKKIKASERRVQQETAVPAENKKEPIQLTPKTIAIFAGLALAIIIPLVIIFTMAGGKEETTTTLPPMTNLPTTTQPTTQNPFGPTTPNNSLINNEVGATDISANPTVAPQPSTRGIFTFYVFGYGHGVGMSQVGANYLANQGWTWAEILSHYYYDANTSIVQGDNYPATINYAGTDYNTREYLAKALESEMGASFNREALKAQCVAIYTFAKYNKFKLESDAHAYVTATPSSVVYSVVDEVMENGFYIANGNSAALTPFHAMSAGKTTSYYNVWGKNSGTQVSYLAGGRKSYGDYLHDDFKSVYTITSEDLKKLIEENDDLKVNLSGDPSTWLTILTHDQAVREDIGYVSTINVGGMVLTGNDFRIKVMEGRIRSHCFALQYTPM